jgi:hypothetical protein
LLLSRLRLLRAPCKHFPDDGIVVTGIAGFPEGFILKRIV